MTPKQIIEIAKQANIEWDDAYVCTEYRVGLSEIKAFAQLVRNAALEEDAVKCENPDLIPNSTFDGMAQEIRSLKS